MTNPAISDPMTLRPFHLAFPVHDLAAARTFWGGTIGCPEGRSPDEWIDFSRFIDLKSIDRVYVVDIMITLAEVTKRSGDNGILAAQRISDAKAKLEAHWGGPVFDRISVNPTSMDQLGAAIGSTLSVAIPPP